MLDMPAKIGPYTILDRLGAGGMGEVFSAHDERLKRRVAIKRLHPDHALTGERLARFRREAQLAAQLNHPAIVQIYDVLEHDGAEHIVMELVEGHSLSQLLADGPLPVERVAAIAVDVLDGLAAAHAQGIIHRDLKAENVLITTAGRAKITDFGIAMSLEPELADTRLTATQDVVGTRRAMAPEQIRGEALDERTDLYAFGVLLYEALTGKSPFRASSVARTISNILEQQPPPVHELDATIPGELSALVSYLLRKRRELRPRSAVEVRERLGHFAAQRPGVDEATMLTATGSPTELPAGEPTPPVRRGRVPAPLMVLAAAAIALLAIAIWRPKPEPTAVAVMKPQLDEPESPWKLVALGAHTAASSALASHPDFLVKASREVDVVAGAPRAVALAVAVEEVVTLDLECAEGSCQVALSRVAGEDGRVLATRSFVMPSEDFRAANAIVTQQVFEAFGRRAVEVGAIPSSEALAAYLRLRQRREDEGATPELASELAALRTQSGEFLEGLLLEADVLRRRFADSRDPADLTTAVELFVRAEALAPHDPRPVTGHCRVLISQGELDAAEAVLGELDQRMPGIAEVLDLRAKLLRERGRGREALAVLRRAASQQPSWKRLSNLAALEASLGEIEAAREHLQDSLRRFPGNLAGMSRLAQIELVAGDVSRAVELYERLVARSPSLPELSNLGLALLLEGQYKRSVEAYQQVLDREPDNPMFALNLADVMQLEGAAEAASELYLRVLELVQDDPDTAAWQLLTVKAQALGHLGRHREAVAAVQRARQLAPDNGQAAFEAALVYSLAGELASAAVNAEQAVELGYAKRWFALPWFDDLRRYDPSFER
ncbi:MAG: protein kinase [Acidobacteriota bacterium]